MTSLRLGYLPGADAPGAHANAHGRIAHFGMHRLEIWVPSPSRFVVRMADIIAHEGFFAAYCALFAHVTSPQK